MPTIRLDVSLPEEGMLEWNFLQEAARAGYELHDPNGVPYVMVDEMIGQENGEGQAEEAGDGAEAENGDGPPPDPFGPSGFGDEAADAEAIAARLEAKWANYGKTGKKKKVSQNCQAPPCGDANVRFLRLAEPPTSVASAARTWPSLSSLIRQAALAPATTVTPASISSHHAMSSRSTRRPRSATRADNSRPSLAAARRASCTT